MVCRGTECVYIYAFLHIMENATPPVACNSRIIDVLYGVVPIARLTCLLQPAKRYQSIQCHRYRSHHFHIQLNDCRCAGVLSGVFQTVVFNTASKIGDPYVSTCRSPGAGLLLYCLVSLSHLIIAIRKKCHCC